MVVYGREVVGPAENELAVEYRIREPYTARRRETRGRKQGDGNGRMEKGREEKEKGKQQGTDVMSLNRIVCAQQGLGVPPISICSLFFKTPLRDTESCLHTYLSVSSCTFSPKMSAEPSSSAQTTAPVVVSVAPSKNGRTPGKAHKSAKTALRRSYISPSVKTPFEKRMEKEKAQQAAKQLEKELKEEKETDRQRFV